MSNVDEQIDFILDQLWMVAYSQRLRHGNKDENVGVASGKIKSLLAQVEKEARIDQMYIEAEAHRLGGGRGLPRHFQQRMDSLQAQPRKELNE